jgi:penicillin-binding protein 2
VLIFDQLKRGDAQLRAVAAAIALGMGLLLGGLWYVQIVSAQRYQADLLDQSFRTVRVPAIRGKILDRNGWELAANRPSYNVNLYFEELRRNFRYEYTNQVLSEYHRLHPNERLNPRLDDALQSRARYYVVSNLTFRISSLIQQPEALDEKRFTNHYNNSRSLPFPLLHDLSPQQIARFVEKSSGLPSLALEVQPVRWYPFGSTAVHVLGYVQHDDNPPEDEEMSFQFRLPDFIGKAGVEQIFDEKLRGRAGVKSVLVNNLQYRQAEETWTAPEPGQNVVLTLDVPIQQATEKALRNVIPDPRGAAVVLDCRNGDVLALASVPAFDPNMFMTHLSDEQLGEITDEQKRPQLNRATYAALPPGSIFKIIVSLACLEAGILRTNDSFVSEGSYKIDGRGHTWKCTAPAGQYDFDRAFYKSCNCYFIDYGLKGGFERIVEMGRRFGLGQRTGLTTRSEAAGFFPDPNEKFKSDGGRWMAGDTANLCIGQGDITVTPLQMAVLTAAIANGGKVFEPRLIDRIEPQNSSTGAQVTRFPPGQIRRQIKLDPANLDIVRNAMLADVEHRDNRGQLDGSGARAGIKEMRVCGKTGTAEVKQGNIVKSHVDWFVSFAPFENPRYAVVVMLETEHGFGGVLCAPIAHDIYQAIVQREHGLATRPHSTLAAK